MWLDQVGHWLLWHLDTYEEKHSWQLHVGGDADLNWPVGLGVQFVQQAAVPWALAIVQCCGQCFGSVFIEPGSSQKSQSGSGSGSRQIFLTD